MPGTGIAKMNEIVSKRSQSSEENILANKINNRGVKYASQGMLDSGDFRVGKHYRFCWVMVYPNPQSNSVNFLGNTWVLGHLVAAASLR